MMNLKSYFDGSLILLIAAAGITGWTMFADFDEDNTLPTKEKIVTEGESIWSIAEFVSKDIDLQLEETVYWLKTENNLENEVIHPGETIIIPAEWNGVAAE
ncbi:cell division suppressor protein YneA [Alkalicoccus daliensis]|uniref:LysM domain-containing protein n=1 Tax=Alkalicoccus daliensis TaxID=745820 RepID=A0A1H0AAZ2_9BACI|nr:LysM peptidoglycan-binding domain-containing protein [Alkalicoccus daliensis]SDN30740.1 hypothetical protein SAMN04488053_101420 [Alkalicoccus daliensis]